MSNAATEIKIGYTFKDKTLLKKALTLSSYDHSFNNQSLECFGDAVLEFIIAEKYYSEGLDEGGITEKKKELSSDAALTRVSERLGLDKSLIRGKGDGKNKKAVPSAYEAVVAAIYLDGGMDCAREFVNSTLDFDAAKGEFDYISALQEEVQAKGQSAPKYLKEECGTPQKPEFIASVEAFGKVYSGRAESFAKAKKKAAKAAYQSLVGQKRTSSGKAD